MFGFGKIAEQFGGCNFGKFFCPDGNAHHGAQSAGSRLLNAGTKWDFVFVWFAPLGNLQPASDRGSNRATAAGNSLRFVFRRRGKRVATDCTFHWVARRGSSQCRSTCKKTKTARSLQY